MTFIELKDRILDFLRRKPQTGIISAVIIILFAAALTIVLIQTSSVKEKKTDNVQDFTPDFQAVIPDGPQLEKDYYPSRTTEPQWSDEQIKQWLTVPDEKNMEDLELANDRIISEITGAAP